MTVCNVCACKEPLIIGRKSVFLLKTSLSSRICYIHTLDPMHDLYIYILYPRWKLQASTFCETLANRSDYRSLNLASTSLPG